MGVISENLAPQLGRMPGTVFFPGWERLCLASELVGSWISLAGERHLPLAVFVLPSFIGTCQSLSLLCSETPVIWFRACWETNPNSQ